MRRCLKVLNLLIEKKVARVSNDKLEVWEYEGMIKHHVERCPSCREFLAGVSEEEPNIIRCFFSNLQDDLRKSEKKSSLS